MFKPNVLHTGFFAAQGCSYSMCIHFPPPAARLTFTRWYNYSVIHFPFDLSNVGCGEDNPS